MKKTPILNRETIIKHLLHMSTNGAQVVLPEQGQRKPNKLIDSGFILE